MEKEVGRMSGERASERTNERTRRSRVRACMVGGREATDVESERKKMKEEGNEKRKRNATSLSVQ